MSNLTLGSNFILDTDCTTTEKKTGATWIDGKPIYRKVITTTSPSSTSAVTYNLGITNPDTVINVIVMIDSRITSPFYATSTNLSYWYLESNRTQMGFTVKDSSWFSKPVHIIIEYTKTTD